MPTPFDNFLECYLTMANDLDFDLASMNSRDFLFEKCNDIS